MSFISFRIKLRHVALLVALIFCVACGSSEGESNQDNTDEPGVNASQNDDEQNDGPDNQTNHDDPQDPNQDNDDDPSNNDTQDNGSENSDQPNHEDPTDLEVDIETGPEHHTNATEATFEFSCNRSGGCSYECQLNDSVPEPCDSPHTYSDLEDGTHTFAVSGVDDEEHTDTAEWDWTIDTEKPEIIDLRGPSSTTAETEATLEFGCSKDDCTFECSLNAGEFESCNSGIHYPDLVDGSYEFAVRPTDALGNWGDEAIHAWTVDTTNIIVTDLTGPDDPTNETTATFEFDCSENECEFECSLNSDDFDTCTSGISYSDLADGEYIFAARTIDASEMTGPESYWEWTVDTVKPEIINLTSPDNPSSESSMIFDFDCSKPNCEFACQLSRDLVGTVEGPENCESGIEFTDLENDTYEFLVHAIDDAGNEGPAVTRSWTVDVEEMAFGFYVPVAEETVISSKSSTFWCQDPHTGGNCSYECALDFDDDTPDGADISDWESCTSPYALGELQAGDYELRVRATSSDGQQVTDIQAWTNHFFDWKSVSAGHAHSCAITVDGQLWCWGAHGDGQLGAGNMEDALHNEAIRTPVQAGDDDSWREVFPGTNHTCALREDNTLWCWGRNSYGVLGLGDAPDPSIPQQVGTADDWKDFSMGDFHHACGVRTDGTLWCWGHNGHGKLGLGDSDDRDSPQQVGDHEGWTRVDNGFSHSCAIRDDGTLWCWGQGLHGRLGLGDDEDNKDTPQRVGSDDDWADVATGNSTTCGLRSDGTLWCWGGNSAGVLGIGESSSKSTPQQVGDDSDWKAPIEVFQHVCARRDGDELWCWGNNHLGRLGIGDTDNRDTPHQVSEDANWSDVAIGRDHTCGIQEDATLWCWGYGHDLGNFDVTNRSVPQQIGRSPN